MKAVRPERPHVARFCFNEKSRISKSIKTESRFVVLGTKVREEWGVTANVFFGVMKCSGISADGCITL